MAAKAMSLSALRELDLVGEDQSDRWSKRLLAAFGETSRPSGFLPLAEEAVAACPGDPHILLLAATAALFDGQPQRAHVFLKRFSKRATAPAQHLLQALTLDQLGRRAAARMLLEKHGLDDNFAATRAFPAGFARLRWLTPRLEAILDRRFFYPGQRRARLAKPKKTAKVTQKAGASRETPGTSGAASGSVAPAPPPAPPPVIDVPAAPALPRPEVDIPLTLGFDAAPLFAALAGPIEPEGRWFSLRQRFLHLGLAQSFDELLCLPQLQGFAPLQHQIETVRKVLKQFRGRVLLADEVGLGKTIEACMVLKEYAMRGMAERVLVLTPASLVGQWREELATKFSLSFATTHDPLLREDAQAFWAQDRIIASIATARRSEHAVQLAARQFDLVIVDEAHHLRERSSQSWKLVDSLNKRFLLLLSATPVQNDLVELYNLLTLLKPGIFKTLKEFRHAYMTPGQPRQPANSERLRALMRDVMVRNTRAVVALKLPRRHATTIRVDGAASEAAAYAELAAAMRRLAGGEAGRRDRLALRHLLSAAGSSPQAAVGALSRLAARHPGEPAWAELQQRWAAIPIGGKESALLDLLQRNPAEKKIVFVHARETLAHLADRVERAGISLVRFDGSLSGPEKDAAIAAFRDHASVLLSTQSGGEGRNIQFCNTLINFDVPWNPMAIEQRIGRIDRIGQTREVFVFNLVTRGTIEEQILALLDEKISMFELVVGEVGAILGGLEEEREFPDLVLDAWLEATEVGRAEAFAALGRRLEQARAQHEDAKALDEALFGEDFETA
jgi:superfamily II DNA or RNA helicase